MRGKNSDALPLRLTKAELRDAAIDETKKGGDPNKAIALALIYIGDAINGLDDSDTADALRTVATEVGGLAIATADAAR
jgi:hypothetical protein